MKTVTRVTGTVTKGNKWVLDFGISTCALVGVSVWAFGGDLVRVCALGLRGECVGWKCEVVGACPWCAITPHRIGPVKWWGLQSSVVKSLEVLVVNAWFCSDWWPGACTIATENQWLTAICYNLGEGARGPGGVWAYTYTQSYTDLYFWTVNYYIKQAMGKSHTQACQQLQQCNNIAIVYAAYSRENTQHISQKMRIRWLFWVFCKKVLDKDSVLDIT